MKIIDVKITGLSGGTVDGGWPQGNKPEEDLNTLLEVVTDEGLSGVGSAMTSKGLIAAAVAVPGYGFMRTRAGGTLPRRSCSSATLSNETAGIGVSLKDRRLLP